MKTNMVPFQDGANRWQQAFYAFLAGKERSTLENFWSLLKRGVFGVFHHVDEEYLPCYLNEFEFRFNRRKVSDEERFATLMERTQGQLPWNYKTPQPENPHA